MILRTTPTISSLVSLASVRGWVAVVVVALVISPGHGSTQGFVWPTLLCYLVADLMSGSLALITGSILPGLVVHALGLLVFFSVIWPTDRYRHPAPLSQQDQAFWIELVACVLLAALSVLAFRRLASSTVAVGLIRRLLTDHATPMREPAFNSSTSARTRADSP